MHEYIYMLEFFTLFMVLFAITIIIVIILVIIIFIIIILILPFLFEFFAFLQLSSQVSWQGTTKLLRYFMYLSIT